MARGESYLKRPNSAQTYDEARARTRGLKPESWLHYQEIAVANGLPTGPHLLWPEEWEAGGRYAGYLGTIPNALDGRDLVSGLQVRKLLRISRKTWLLLTSDLTPDATVSHKHYYEAARVWDHVASRIDRLTKSDAIERLRSALDEWANEWAKQ